MSGRGSRAGLPVTQVRYARRQRYARGPPTVTRHRGAPRGVPLIGPGDYIRNRGSYLLAPRARSSGRYVDTPAIAHHRRSSRAGYEPGHDGLRSPPVVDPQPTARSDGTHFSTDRRAAHEHFHATSGARHSMDHEARAAGRDADVKTILLDIDSPGGSAAGAAECAAELRAIRARKPIIAQANHQACSAAYWIGSQATKFYASPSSLLGSVGVYMLHDDLSEALALLGIKREYIFEGKFKVEGNEAEPLTDEARAHFQHLVSGTYDRFVSDIAKGRGVTVASVRKGYGEGRVLPAADAFDAGMIDAIATLEETLTRLGPASAPPPAVPLPFSQSSVDTSKEPDAATDKDRREDCYANVRDIERAFFDWSVS